MRRDNLKISQPAIYLYLTWSPDSRLVQIARSHRLDDAIQWHRRHA